MHGFSNILVYSALGDEALYAVDQAARLARSSGASITVLRVLEDEGLFSRWSGQPDAHQQLRDAVVLSQLELLEGHVQELLDEGIEVDVEVRWGTPWLELIHSVLRDGYDLVVKTAEGATRGRGLFFGSTALHLIRKCPCPVWVVGGDPDQASGRVLAAIDPARDEVRDAVAERLINLAASVAGESGELHAVSVWRAEGERLFTNRMPKDRLAEYVRAARDEAREGLEGAIARSGQVLAPESVHLVKGEARDALPRWIEGRGFDLVVMGSLGRVGIAGFLIGETAETLIRSMHCSVLVVKPPGFVSPIQLPEAAGRHRAIRSHPTGHVERLQ